MTVRASKTEHHDDGGIRMVPIFPELRPHLEAAWELADEGAEWVATRYRHPGQNLRTTFQKIIVRAGERPWPKLFQNLRASHQTELLQSYPIKDVCDWLGNSRAVAMRHYAMPTAETFRRARDGPDALRTRSKIRSKIRSSAQRYPKRHRPAPKTHPIARLVRSAAR